MTLPSDNTSASIIQDAYLDAGLISQGDTINGEQVVFGMRRLRDLINYLQTKGLKLWLNEDLPVPLVAGKSTYTFSPSGDIAITKPLRVVEAWYTSSTGIRRPLIPLSWNDYSRLSQVNQSGAMNSYFVNKQATQLSVFFWLTPDATTAMGQAHLLTQVQVVQPVSSVEDLNFPIEWRMALRWGMASEISTGQPQAIMDRCQQFAETYRIALEDWDVEDAPTRFTMDSRSGMSKGAFQ